MKTQGIKDGVIAIRAVEPDIDDWLNTEPPLGTCDEDGNPTSELDYETCIAGTYKKTQAVMGKFEQVYGKVGMSLTIDEDKSDFIDLTVGRDVTKGYQNVEGTFEFEMLNDDGRWDGASQGNWDYVSKAYFPRPIHRPYDMWILLNPDKKTLYATSAERLWKLYGVKLGRVEIDVGQPNKFRVPFSARLMIPHMNWTQPGAVKVLTAQAIADASVSLSVPISSPNVFQTRLKFTFTGVGTSKQLTVTGYNIFGEKVKEDVDLSALSGTYTYITKEQFNFVDTLGVTLSGGWLTGTFDIDEYDVGLRPA